MLQSDKRLASDLRHDVPQRGISEMESLNWISASRRSDACRDLRFAVLGAFDLSRFLSWGERIGCGGTRPFASAGANRIGVDASYFINQGRK